MRALQILLALCLVPTAIVTAQSRSAAWPLDSGSRIRIQAPIFGDKTREGTVLNIDADTLRFRPWPVSFTNAVAVHDITRIEVQQGTHGRKMKGALIGLALGGGIAAGITAATWKKPTGFALDFGRAGDAAFTGLFGALAGGLVGALIGAVETETWVPVRPPNR